MKKRLIATLASLALVTIVGTSGVTAARAPEYYSGNPKCDGTKIDPVNSGTYALPDGGSITIVVGWDKGDVFSFSTSAGFVVSSIMVKGGPNALLWFFDDATAGAGLHAPQNKKFWYGLSHLCIQSEKKVVGAPDTK